MTRFRNRCERGVLALARSQDVFKQLDADINGFISREESTQPRAATLPLVPRTLLVTIETAVRVQWLV
eukprot:SAG31_NODE_20558_length_571_cov_0.762712_2_plen_68_part_00